MKTITRQQATAEGSKRYFTGEPCKRGHVCERYVLRCVFVDCHNLWKRPKAYSNAYSKRHRKAHPEKALLASIRARAKRKGIECTIAESDIVVPTHCPVLGLALKPLGGKRESNTMSVDRIDNTRGYVPGNICVISWRANHHKSNLSLQEVKQLAVYMEKGSEK